MCATSETRRGQTRAISGERSVTVHPMVQGQYTGHAGVGKASPRKFGGGSTPRVYLRWSKTFCTPVFTDGLDAFVFGFSFFGLRISRFDFCCFDMG